MDFWQEYRMWAVRGFIALGFLAAFVLVLVLGVCIISVLF